MAFGNNISEFTATLPYWEREKASQVFNASLKGMAAQDKQAYEKDFLGRFNQAMSGGEGNGGLSYSASGALPGQSFSSAEEMNNALRAAGLPTAEGQSGGANSPSTYQNNFSSLYPNLSATQGQVSANTLSQLRGELSPETLNSIQDSAARFGIGSGMPLGGGGSTIAGNYGRKLVGQTSQGLQSQGLQNYLNTLQGYSGTLMPTTGETIGAETSRYATDVGAATQRYGIDTGAKTAANSLGEQARQYDTGLGWQKEQFGQTFPESQRQFDSSLSSQNRQFDISSYLQNQQANNQLGLGYAGLGQNYLNSYLSFLQ